MSRIFLFALIFSVAACKLEPMDKTNELQNEFGSNGGDINLGTEIPTTTAVWVTGNLSLYSLDADERLINGKFSITVNGKKINNYGDFVFSEAEDFDYFIQNKELFEVANTVPLTLKVKLIRKASSCQASPDSEYCATVFTPNLFEIEDIQPIE